MPLTEKELREQLAKGGFADELIESIVKTQISAGLCKADVDPLAGLDPDAIDRHLEEVAKALDAADADRLAKAGKCCDKCGAKVDDDGKAMDDEDDEDEEDAAAKAASALRTAGLFKALELVSGTHKELVKAQGTLIQTMTAVHGRLGELEKAVSAPMPGKAVTNIADVQIQPAPGEQIVKGALVEVTVPNVADLVAKKDRLLEKATAEFKAPATTHERRSTLKKALIEIESVGSNPDEIATKYGL